MPSPPRILVVAANDADIERHKGYFSAMEFHLETATDGAAALECVRRFNPHLILLDSMIGNPDGFQICKQIKFDPSTRRTMIIMITALNELGDIERAVAAGTDDFISTPVNKTELLKRVVNLLKRKDLQE